MVQSVGSSFQISPLRDTLDQKGLLVFHGTASVANRQVKTSTGESMQMSTGGKMKFWSRSLVHICSFYNAAFQCHSIISKCLVIFSPQNFPLVVWFISDELPKATQITNVSQIWMFSYIVIRSMFLWDFTWDLYYSYALIIIVF